jgi:hypothetical protein
MAEIDDIFRQFAACFAGAIEDANPICHPEMLDRDALDLTLESLKAVDGYLTHLHQHKDALDPAEWNSTVLYGGAYVGEVIREETQGYFSWMDYSDYMAAHPELESLIPERNVATCAFLVDPVDGMSMPLNKIARFIDEGPENSVHFFAHCDIVKSQKQV